MARKNLYINDTNLGTYGIYITSDTVLNSPQIDYTEYSVPGKNGNVIQYNKRMNNVVRKFTCHVPSSGNPKTAIDGVKKLIYLNPGYVKIKSDYEQTYQVGYLAQGIDVAPFDQYKNVTFDLYFSCRPEKRYTSGTNAIINSGSYSYGYYNVLGRNDLFIQQLFNSIPQNQIPTDEWFAVAEFVHQQSVSYGSCYTSYSQATDKGFAALVKGDVANGTISSVVAVDRYDGEASGSLNTTATENAYAVFSFSGAGMSVHYTEAGQPETVITIDPNTQTINNSNAIGHIIDSLEVNYYFNGSTPSSYQPATLFISGNNELIIKTDFSKMDASLMQTLYNDWTTTSGANHLLKLVFDENMNCCIKKGTLMYPFNDYVKTIGGFTLYGDTIKVNFFPYSGTYGKIQNISIKGGWFEL